METTLAPVGGENVKLDTNTKIDNAKNIPLPSKLVYIKNHPLLPLFQHFMSITRNTSLNKARKLQKYMTSHKYR